MNTNQPDLPVLYPVHRDDFPAYDDRTIRKRFVLENLYANDRANFCYTHYDRMIAGVIAPVTSSVSLDSYNNLKSTFFFERREAGIVNTGGEGIIYIDGTSYRLQKLDCVYIGRGTRTVDFETNNAEDPAVFFFLSAPAHANFPTTLRRVSEVMPLKIGSAPEFNARSILKYIHDEGIPSCQLVMGITVLEPGSIWNTIPPHLHDRRSEIYFYFDLADHNYVTHFMGYPDQHRELLVRNRQAVVSPPWSIHAGRGSSHYSFVWGMAGENKDFSDMDRVEFNKGM